MASLSIVQSYCLLAVVVCALGLVSGQMSSSCSDTLMTTCSASGGWQVSSNTRAVSCDVGSGSTNGSHSVLLRCDSCNPSTGARTFVQRSPFNATAPQVRFDLTRCVTGDKLLPRVVEIASFPFCLPFISEPVNLTKVLPVLASYAAQTDLNYMLNGSSSGDECQYVASASLGTGVSLNASLIPSGAPPGAGGNTSMMMMMMMSMCVPGTTTDGDAVRACFAPYDETVKTANSISEDTLLGFVRRECANCSTSFRNTSGLRFRRYEGDYTNGGPLNGSFYDGADCMNGTDCRLFYYCANCRSYALNTSLSPDDLMYVTGLLKRVGDYYFDQSMCFSPVANSTFLESGVVYANFTVDRFNGVNATALQPPGPVYCRRLDVFRTQTYVYGVLSDAPASPTESSSAYFMTAPTMLLLMVSLLLKVIL